MSVGGALFAVALGFIGAGLDNILVCPRKLPGAALIALGAAAMGMAYALMSKGI